MKAETNRIVTSFAVSPKMLETLQEYKRESGISTSWLINSLLKEYFSNVGGKRNGE